MTSGAMSRIARPPLTAMMRIANTAHRFDVTGRSQLSSTGGGRLKRWALADLERAAPDYKMHAQRFASATIY